MIDFQPLTPSLKDAYEAISFACSPRGCEYTFANLFLWGHQQIAFIGDCVAFFSHVNGRCVYPYPIGPGDKRSVLEEIFQDARQRDIPCYLTSMTGADLEELNRLFPGAFSIFPHRDSFDYVYAVEDLAHLQGRKYQKKRNHFNRFHLEHPGYRVLPLTEETMFQAQDMVTDWFRIRAETASKEDYLQEIHALNRAFQHYYALGMEGIALIDGGEILAITLGSVMGPETFDVHFEKARENIEGAYSAVNCEFSRYIREKFPQIRFLNREDDLGLEGLRKAKLSYHPHHMVEKYWGCPREDIYGN